MLPIAIGGGLDGPPRLSPARRSQIYQWYSRR